jgi:hypothetical protein
MSVEIREATYVSTSSHRYPLVPLRAIAPKLLTLFTVSLVLMVAGCTWRSTKRDFGPHHATVTHSRYESQSLISSPERRRSASMNRRHHHWTSVKHPHHSWAAVNRRQAVSIAPASLDCKLRPHPDLCGYSPVQFRTIGSNSLGNGESNVTNDGPERKVGEVRVR